MNTEQKLYNVVKLSNANGLTDHRIQRSMDYTMLYSATTGSNVKFKYNDSSSDSIDIPVGTAIKTKNAVQLFISADTVANGEIVIIQARNSTDFEMFLPVTLNSIKTIDEVTSFNATLLTALDKIANPYQNPVYVHASTSSSAYITLFDISSADFDKVKVNFGFETSAGGGFVGSYHSLVLIIDDINVATYQRALNHNTPTDNDFVFENVRGKKIQIKGSSSNGYIFATLQKFNLKA